MDVQERNFLLFRRTAYPAVPLQSSAKADSSLDGQYEERIFVYRRHQGEPDFCVRARDRECAAGILAAAALATTLTANAQSSAASAADHAAHHPAAAASPQSDGEVRKVDKEEGKVTLRHGPLQNLDMPAMTMVFKASDPKLLAGLKESDKVKFTAERVNGVIAVTAIEAAK